MSVEFNILKKKKKKGGKRRVQLKDINSRLEWAKILADLLEKIYVAATKITLAQDNLKAYKPAAMPAQNCPKGG